ncbi:MAG TPA: hypothetical protein VFW87_20750, partial [Pirellulales bacterium]|nr:hypothetical protein [Pirellulales bacterium]
PGMLDETMSEGAGQPEVLPTPEADEAMPVPNNSGVKRAPGEPARVEMAGAHTLTKEFEWGPLGLKSESKAAQDDTWSRIVGKSEEAARPTHSVLKQPRQASRAPAGMPEPAGSSPATGRNLQQVKHQEAWQPTP